MEKTDSQAPGRSWLSEYLKVIFFTLLIAFALKVLIVDAYRIPTGSMENTLLAGDFILVNKFIYGPTTPRYVPLTNVEIPFIRFPGLSQPDRGDVIVFRFPGERDEVIPSENLNYIKRCIGLPGDTVELRDKKVFVNSRSLPSVQTMKKGIGRANPRGRNDLRIFPSGTSFNEDNYGPIYVPGKGDTLLLSLDNIKQWMVFLQRDGAEVDVTNDGSIMIDGIVTSRYGVRKNYYFMLGDNRDNSLDSRFWGFVPEDHIIGQAILVYWSWRWDGSASHSIVTRFRNIRTDRIGTVIR
jgi:signal peptidase I